MVFYLINCETSVGAILKFDLLVSVTAAGTGLVISDIQNQVGIKNAAVRNFDYEFVYIG